MEPPSAEYLRTYLTDHWAAAGGGVALVRRIADQNRNTQWATELDDLVLQISADEQALQAIRTSLGFDVDTLSAKVRRSAVLIAERLSRLKLNGRLVSYSPLSRVLEAEGLISGITAKQRLWLALKDSVATEIPDVDFDGLVVRAESQLVTMRAFHQWAVTRAFGVLATA